MNAFWLVVLTNAVFVHSLTVIHKSRHYIVAKSRVELHPIRIICFRHDIIRISAPIINANTQYQLTKPNGDVINLDLKTPEKLKPYKKDTDFLKLRVIKRLFKPIVTMEVNYDVFNMRQDDDVFIRKESEMNANDFLLGPVGDEDHGNWVLSVFTENLDGEIIEMFQVISVDIIEYVHMVPERNIVSPGGTFHLKMAYPVQDLVSCELIAPKTSYDRIFERSKLEVDRCGFVLRNVTKADAGIWRVVAVGNIIYEGGSTLYVFNKTEHD